MKAYIEYHEFIPRAGVHARKATPGGMIDVGMLGPGAWTCPRCGCMQFTVEEKFGQVVLACFRCPTYLKLVP
jgi:hypothetical protein